MSEDRQSVTRRRLFQLAKLGRRSTLVQVGDVRSRLQLAGPANQREVENPLCSQRGLFGHCRMLVLGRRARLEAAKLGIASACADGTKLHLPLPLRRRHNDSGEKRSRVVETATDLVLNTCKLLVRCCWAPRQPRGTSSWIGSARSRPSTVAWCGEAEAVVAPPCPRSLVRPAARPSWFYLWKPARYHANPRAAAGQAQHWYLRNESLIIRDLHIAHARALGSFLTLFFAFLSFSHLIFRVRSGSRPPSTSCGPPALSRSDTVLPRTA